ncbi:hypothetical protein AZL_f01610 (plasmid) [Azospirillum sp. B510]|uniref:O-linked N-acetylglucosamine transferase, SPINDLY family protein n=1 Tax=Azospirillum sp. (strain B510) TaxID=137722 RepID=UPI0001C4CD3A|nr:hypothetical protein [Azospirillum sp. B510]BAI76921.1 hypothetical protein AZL_f01610 [Azospirillum sp. B510]
MIVLRDLAEHAFRLYQQNRFDEADAACRIVLAHHPDHAGFLQFLATIRVRQNRTAEGLVLYRRILAISPEWIDAWYNLTVALEGDGRHEAASGSLKRAAAIAPDAAGLYGKFGTLYRNTGLLALARLNFVRAALLAPDDASIRISLGVALRELREVKGSTTTLGKAIACDPAAAEAHLQHAHGLRELGRLADAMVSYGRARRLAPGRSDILNYHLYCKQNLCDWQDHEALCQAVLDTIDQDGGTVIPLAVLTIPTTPGQQRLAVEQFYRRLLEPQAPAPLPSRPAAAPRGARPLRVAYLSADFYEHATAYLAAELFERHDRSRVVPLAYSYGPDDGSPMRRRLETAFAKFYDIRAAGADEVARHMAEIGVDILVDLKGHTKNTRFDLITRRLAPVQVAYLGYPGTSGLPHMDYIVGDAIVTPPDHQPHYTEQLLLLPDSYQINGRDRPLPERTPVRAAYGLPENSFVFCSFNALQKLSPAIFALWMRLLARVPGSVLWLYGGAPDGERNLRREAAARGVAPDRLLFASKLPLADHLARYRVADLCLDTLPYTGHTTTSDALWMGCPVVTCLGGTFASRVAASLLTAAGLPELITHTLEEYETLAVRLAEDATALAALRRHLEDNRLHSPLFDAKRFVHHLERAYDIMWQLHAGGHPPRSFALRATHSPD